jgi:hypothetical protein
MLHGLKTSQTIEDIIVHTFTCSLVAEIRPSLHLDELSASRPCGRDVSSSTAPVGRYTSRWWCPMRLPDADRFAGVIPRLPVKGQSDKRIVLGALCSVQIS